MPKYKYTIHDNVTGQDYPVMLDHDPVDENERQSIINSQLQEKLSKMPKQAESWGESAKTVAGKMWEGAKGIGESLEAYPSGGVQKLTRGIFGGDYQPIDPNAMAAKGYLQHLSGAPANILPSRSPEDYQEHPFKSRAMDIGGGLMELALPFAGVRAIAPIVAGSAASSLMKELPPRRMPPVQVGEERTLKPESGDISNEWNQFLASMLAGGIAGGAESLVRGREVSPGRTPPPIEQGPSRAFGGGPNQPGAGPAALGRISPISQGSTSEAGAVVPETPTEGMRPIPPAGGVQLPQLGKMNRYTYIMPKKAPPPEAAYQAPHEVKAEIIPEESAEVKAPVETPKLQVGDKFDTPRGSYEVLETGGDRTKLKFQSVKPGAKPSIRGYSENEIDVLRKKAQGEVTKPEPIFGSEKGSLSLDGLEPEKVKKFFDKIVAAIDPRGSLLDNPLTNPTVSELDKALMKTNQFTSDLRRQHSEIRGTERSENLEDIYDFVRGDKSKSYSPEVAAKGNAYHDLIRKVASQAPNPQIIEDIYNKEFPSGKSESKSIEGPMQSFINQSSFYINHQPALKAGYAALKGIEDPLAKSSLEFLLDKRSGKSDEGMKLAQGVGRFAYDANTYSTLALSGRLQELHLTRFVTSTIPEMTRYGIDGARAVVKGVTNTIFNPKESFRMAADAGLLGDMQTHDITLWKGMIPMPENAMSATKSILNLLNAGNAIERISTHQSNISLFRDIMQVPDWEVKAFQATVDQGGIGGKIAPMRLLDAPGGALVESLVPYKRWFARYVSEAIRDVGRPNAIRVLTTRAAMAYLLYKEREKYGLPLFHMSYKTLSPYAAKFYGNMASLTQAVIEGDFDKAWDVLSKYAYPGAGRKQGFLDYQESQ